MEAGISPEFVQLALAELGGTSNPPKQLSGWKDRAATRLLGVWRRSLEVSRTMPSGSIAVLEAIQRVFPAHPYLLTLYDTVGDDPFDGGILVFRVPSVYSSSTYTSFAYHMATADIKHLRAVIRPLPTEGTQACEVVISTDLRPGVRTNWWVGSSLTGAFGGGGAAIGAGIGAGALGLGGALLALPALAGGAVVGGATALAYGAMYRWGMRKATEDLEELLRAVAANARTRGAFPPPQPTRPAGGATTIVGI